ncbi:uncharacterized protein LOC143881044 [Tasmannia lanceolata]|uniref:uncharacterized protein LOC143881044 n=1 Tax=Tasmannia lanceolata TaxID=3420 RepID=UPI004062D5B2
MKEPSSSSSKKPPSSLHKIKLFCRFNGAFRPSPPHRDIRYVGGEARILSIDRRIGFSLLLSKISELCPKKNPFCLSLKYQFPKPEHGVDAPLVCVETDDDVRSMIKELILLEARGKSVLIRLFVCDCDSKHLDGKVPPLKILVRNGVFPCNPQHSITNGQVGESNYIINRQIFSHDEQSHWNRLHDIGNYQTCNFDGKPYLVRSCIAVRPKAIISKFGPKRLLNTQLGQPWYGSREHIREGMRKMVESSKTQPSSNLENGRGILRERFVNQHLGMVNHFCGHEGILFAGKPYLHGDRLGYYALNQGFLGAEKPSCHIGFQSHSPGIAIGNPIPCFRAKTVRNDHLFDLNRAKNENNKPFSDVDKSPEACEDSLNFSVCHDGSQKCEMGPQISQFDLKENRQLSSGPKNETELGSTMKLSGLFCPAMAQESVSMRKDIPHSEEHGQASPYSSNMEEKVSVEGSNCCSEVVGKTGSELATLYANLASQELQEIKNSDLEEIRKLGSGTYGTVSYGKWKGSDVAIKRIKPDCFEGGDVGKDRLISDFWKEARLLGQLRHPNIVALYGVVTDGPSMNLATVTEYMANGSLKQVLNKKDRSIDRRKRLIIAMDAAFGMEYLHEKNIVHFDLKSHNFLVNMKDPLRPVCKIGDLGLSKVKNRTLVSGGVRGTIPWMAPELLTSESNMVTEKVDVYSFGIVMWELLTGEEPYGNMHSKEIIAGIFKGDLRPEIPRWCEPGWRSLMERCWSSDPNSRPSFSEIAKELRSMSASLDI